MSNEEHYDINSLCDQFLEKSLGDTKPTNPTTPSVFYGITGFSHMLKELKPERDNKDMYMVKMQNLERPVLILIIVSLRDISSIGSNKLKKGSIYSEIIGLGAGHLCHLISSTISDTGDTLYNFTIRNMDIMTARQIASLLYGV